MQVTLTG